MQARESVWRRTLAAIAAGGFIAGTIDIGAAALINRKSVTWILHAIAGGLLAAASFRGGSATAWLGLLLQWGMSLLIAAIFCVAALRLRWMLERTVFAGLAYGIVVFVVMNYVVMPLSAWHRVNDFPPLKFVENLAAMLLFGLIVAACARRGLRRGRSATVVKRALR